MACGQSHPVARLSHHRRCCPGLRVQVSAARRCSPSPTLCPVMLHGAFHCRTFTSTHRFSVDGSIAAMPPFSQWFMTGDFRGVLGSGAAAVSTFIVVVMILFPYILWRRSITGSAAIATVPASTLGLRSPNKGSHASKATELRWWEQRLLGHEARPFSLTGALLMTCRPSL